MVGARSAITTAALAFTNSASYAAQVAARAELRMDDRLGHAVCSDPLDARADCRRRGDLVLKQRLVARIFRIREIRPLSSATGLADADGDTMVML
jgi:hypothetical protein